MGLAFTALLGLLAPLGALAQDGGIMGDAGRGHALAGSLCKGCHLIAPDQKGPVRDGVPSFAALARRSDGDLLTALDRLAVRPHPPMPALPLDTQQTRDVAAYIRSLARPDS